MHTYIPFLWTQRVFPTNFPAVCALEARDPMQEPPESWTCLTRNPPSAGNWAGDLSLTRPFAFPLGYRRELE